jgi:multisubunit Na+/H+ antiporter MnhG subunit
MAVVAFFVVLLMALLAPLGQMALAKEARYTTIWTEPWLEI